MKDEKKTFLPPSSFQQAEAFMPDQDSHFPGAPSQPDVPAPGDPPPASSRQAVQSGAVAVAAMVFVVGGIAWAYHLVQRRGTQPASKLQQTQLVSQPVMPRLSLPEEPA